MTISELCKAARANSLAHGFYDNQNTVIGLIGDEEVAYIADHTFELASIARMHSELAEAAEAAPGELSTKIPGYLLSSEELGDLAIRILDHCGDNGPKLEDAYTFLSGHTSLGYLPSDQSLNDVCKTLPQLIAECHYHLGCATEASRKSRSTTPYFAAILNAVNAHYFNYSTDDLMDAITAKMKYNESRPYKHGKVS